MCSYIGRNLIVENGEKPAYKILQTRINAWIRKANTIKIVSKIFHNSRKVGFNVKRRRNIKLSEKGSTPNEVHPDKLKFGFINVDMLVLETEVALRGLPESRGFDVSIHSFSFYKKVLHKKPRLRFVQN